MLYAICSGPVSVLLSPVVISLSAILTTHVCSYKYVCSSSGAQYVEPQSEFLNSFNSALEWTKQLFRKQYKVFFYLNTFDWIQASIYLRKSV